MFIEIYLNYYLKLILFIKFIKVVLKINFNNIKLYYINRLMFIYWGKKEILLSVYYV